MITTPQGKHSKNEIKRAGMKYINRSPDEKYKDWNDQLTDTKQRHKPITRLIKRSLADSQEQIPYAKSQKASQLQK